MISSATQVAQAALSVWAFRLPGGLNATADLLVWWFECNGSFAGMSLARVALKRLDVFCRRGLAMRGFFRHCFDIVAEQDAIVYRLELCVSLSAAENPGVLSDGGVNASLAGCFGAATR